MCPVRPPVRPYGHPLGRIGEFVRRQSQPDQSGFAFVRMAKTFQHQRCGEACCCVGQIASRIRRYTAGHGDTGLAKQSLRCRLIQYPACCGRRQGGIGAPVAGWGRDTGVGDRP